MSRRKCSSGLVCGVCGQEIEEKHAFHVHKVGTKKEYILLHGECIDKYAKTRKRVAEKSK